MTETSQFHIFGEVLFDHFPDGTRVLGGAPFNVAWHLQAFGQGPRFISRIGDDAPGQEIVALMAGWGMRCDGLQHDTQHPTGSVRVLIEDGEPHYDIVADSAYDFISAAELGMQSAAGILYHGSLALRNAESRAALQAAKTRHHGKIFIDVNLRPPWWDRGVLAPLLADAHWLKLNESELATFCPQDDGLQAAMERLCGAFGLETLVVTRGAQGAAAFDKQMGFMLVEAPQNIAVVDTVGAGDAFSALLLLGMARHWPLAITLQRARAFAAALVGRRGATVAGREFYSAFAAQWHL